jgi:hypothetical protein
MDKMNVVTFRSTNHILGALVRTAQATTPVTVDQVAASGVLIRDSKNLRLQTLIDASLVQVAEIDYDTRVFYRPQLFAVNGGHAEQQTDSNTLTAALNGVTVTVTLPAAAPGATEVFVHVSGGVLTEPIVRAVQIATTATVGVAGLVLGSGTYKIAIFAPGYLTVIMSDAVP